MILIPELIKKLKEIEEYYPNIPVDIDTINIHVSAMDDELPVTLTFGKNDVKVCSMLNE